jgi:hypothetical protein
VRPRLQTHASPLITALICATFWAPWHVFLWFGEGKSVVGWRYWVDIYINVISAAIVIGWFYSRSKGSILVGGNTHAARSTAIAFLANLNWDMRDVTVLAAALPMVIPDRMWRRLPSGHPAVYTSETLAA